MNILKEMKEPNRAYKILPPKISVNIADNELTLHVCCSKVYVTKRDHIFPLDINLKYTWEFPDRKQIITDKLFLNIEDIKKYISNNQKEIKLIVSSEDYVYKSHPFIINLELLLTIYNRGLSYEL